MVVKICVGSSCHLKGSYEVIEKLKELVKKYKLENKLELKASFCLGHCSDGVTIMADDEYIFNLSKENTEEIFLKEIYPKI